MTPKALFLGLPLHGHINPTLALVRELVARGHEVAYFATSAFAADLERAGARFHAYAAGCLADLDDLFVHTDDLPRRLMRTSARVLESHLAEFQNLRPSYVITDSVAPWGQWAGQVLDVPVVTSITTFAFNRRVMAYAATHGVTPTSLGRLASKLRSVASAAVLQRDLRRRHHVRGPGIMGSVMGHSALNLVYTSRYFQPCADTFDEGFRFVGPSIDARRESGDVNWGPVTGQALVYVSLGTVFNADAAFYRTCFEAFADEDFQVIMSTGAKVAPASLGSAPRNVIVRPHVPQLQVLRRAAAFITHGGMNSVSESLVYSVPLVVVPQMGEQAIVGRRVEELEAGLYVAKEDATAERLRQSVARLTADGRFRRGAAAIKQSFENAGGVAKAADAVQAVAS